MEAMMNKKIDVHTFRIMSRVNMRGPVVHISGHTPVGYLSSDEAREIAAAIVEAADSADAAIEKVRVDSERRHADLAEGECCYNDDWCTICDMSESRSSGM
jgi:enamine deaminase RidA (YjgF/YER057c/UK114 family)